MPSVDTPTYFIVRRRGVPQEGPYTEAELRDLLRDGSLTSESFYLQQGAVAWLPVEPGLRRKLSGTKGRLPLWFRVWLLVVVSAALCAGAWEILSWWQTRKPSSAASASSADRFYPATPALPTPVASPIPRSTPATAAREASPMRVADIVRKLRPSVGLIKTFDRKNKAQARGTGWFLSEDGLFVTNYHVIKDAAKIIVKLHDGTLCTAETVYYQDEEADFAILRMDGGGYHPVELRPADEPPQEGEEVVVVGNPLGLEGTVTTGIVSAVRQDKSRTTWVQISAPISPGSSGSPVADSRGRVLGMATLSYENGQALNFALLAADITRALKEDTYSRETSLSALNDREEEILETIKRLEEIMVRTEREKPSKADLDLIASALEKYRADARVVGRVGEAYGLIDRSKEADDAFLGWRGEPSLEITTRYAGFLYDQKRFAEVETEARKGIKIDPEDSKSWCLLGCSLASQKSPAQAAKAFRTSIELNRDAWLPWRELGQLQLLNGEAEQGIACLQQSIVIHPTSAAYRSLLLGLVIEKRFQEGVVAGEAYVALRPEDPVGLDALSWCYHKMGKTKVAIPLVEKSLKLDPEDKLAWSHLSVYLAKTDEKRAKYAYQQYLKLGGEEKAPASSKLSAGAQAIAGVYKYAGPPIFPYLNTDTLTLSRDGSLRYDMSLAGGKGATFLGTWSFTKGTAIAVLKECLIEGKLVSPNPEINWKPGTELSLRIAGNKLYINGNMDEPYAKVDD